MENNIIYSVYVHKVDTEDGPMYYVGTTGMNTKKRWVKNGYRTTAIFPYIEKYGWDNLEHAIVFETDNYKKSREVEDQLILFYTSIGKQINHRRSGLITANGKTAWTRYKMHNDPDYAERQRYSFRMSKRRQLSKPEGKIYNRVNNFNRQHPDRIVETPLEAKRKYLESGYIPEYIKHSDL